MSWADEKIANRMGYEYAVLFPRAFAAIEAYATVTENPIVVPENICPLFKNQPYIKTETINQETGLADLPVQLYGYRQEFPEKLEIDPLMTGWVGKPCCESTIISFGFKKTLNVGCGGAFLTNNQGLAQEMEPRGYLPGGLDDTELTTIIKVKLEYIHRVRESRFELLAKWDAALGDLLPRIPMEQVMPWRVMRRVPENVDDLDPDLVRHAKALGAVTRRDKVVRALRAGGIPVGTNYPPLEGSNKWGDEIINFFPEYEHVERAAVRIEQALNG